MPTGNGPPAVPSSNVLGREQFGREQFMAARGETRDVPGTPCGRLMRAASDNVRGVLITEGDAAPGTALLIAAAPAGKGRLVDASSVLPSLAAVPPSALTGT
ncbi:hypothetical protein FFZ77_25455, partial [Streptomyces katsurahamanus]|nr:hypothetical protein [Streptomyces katsurahamanus]